MLSPKLVELFHPYLHFTFNLHFGLNFSKDRCHWMSFTVNRCIEKKYVSDLLKVKVFTKKR